MMVVNGMTPHISVARRKNTWFTVADGNFVDPTIWQSNGTKRHTIPQIGDDIIVNNILSFSSNSVVDLNNISVSGQGALKFPAGGVTFIVRGNLQVNGLLDCTGATPTITLYGANNFVTSYVMGFSSVQYASTNCNQYIMNLPYFDLNISLNSAYTAYQTSDLVILDAMSISNNSNYEVGGHSLTVTARLTLGQNSNFSKTTAGGTILFKDLVNSGSSANWNFTAGDDVEFRNGINGNFNNMFTGASSTYKFTTANQNLNAGGIINFEGNVTIAAGITLTVLGSGGVNLRGDCEGLSGTSTLNVQGLLNLYTSTVPMSTTGVFNYNSNSNSVIGYYMPGNYTLPYTTYSGIYVSGGGIKSISGNTTCTSLWINSTSSPYTTFELGTYNFTDSGIFNIAANSLGGGNNTLKRSTATGSTIITGSCNFGFNGAIDMTAGADIEFRGGGNMFGIFNGGAGKAIFSTNNQALNITFNFTNLYIAGAITMTINNGSGITVSNSLAGDAGAILMNAGEIDYQGASAPMPTGTLNLTTNANTFKYNGAINQDIKAGNYRTLSLQGNATTKKLLGNVSVANTYTLGAGVTLNNNGFALTNP